MKEPNVKRNYKDSLFRMLFNEKENLLSLYNALNQTTYTNVGKLEITTLENAVYMNYKNDISFVFGYEVRMYTKKMSFPEAVEKAVDYCIKNGILSDFLSKNRAEAIEVSIFEYDEEKHMKSEREWAYNNGLAEGKQLGLTEGKQLGEQRLLKLYKLLLESGRNEDLNRISNDEAYREQLYQENNL